MRTAAILAALAMAGAAQAQDLTAEQALGKATFEKTCAYCHRARGFGTEALGKRLGEDNAWLEKRTDLPTDYIRQVLRTGIGNMPAYTPTDLTAAERDAIAAYLTRNNKE